MTTHVTEWATVAPTDDDVRRFGALGFLAFERLVEPDELADLRAAYDEVVSSGRDGARHLGGLTRQVVRPSDYHDLFADNPVRDRAGAIAQRLLGGPAIVVFDQLLMKPAGHPHETPWHQDMSYVGVPTAPAGADIPLDRTLQFWVALDDVGPEGGCMEFVPGQHTRPLLPHIVASGEPDAEDRLLALADPATQLDLSTAVACPLAAGGATVHNFGTPHYTGPNRSTSDRRAYIMTFVNPAALGLTTD